jgi:crossover junction endodeoxyribonuclease RuvC
MGRWTLGIDPGVSGAFALLRDGGGGLATVESVMDMPVLLAEGAKSRRILDCGRIVRLLEKLSSKTGGNLMAVLEEVRSMPRDGHVGAFAFGRTYGVLETALAAARIPYRTVRPAVWKRAMGVTADKDQARAMASRLLPSGAGLWPLKKHDGRAEAALLALYGSKERNGE